MDDSRIHPKMMTGLDDLITSPPNAPYFDVRLGNPPPRRG